MGKKKKGKQVTKNKSNDKNKNVSQNQKQEPNKELSHKMSLEMDQESSQDQTVKSRFSSEGLIVSIENLGSIIETKNKMTRFDKILKILPVVISVSMLIITFFSYKTSVISNEISERSLKISANNNKISERSLEISKANQSLTFDNEIENIKGRGNEYHEDTNGNYKIILPLRVKTRVDSGKAKAVYVVTDDKRKNLIIDLSVFSPTIIKTLNYL